MGNVSYVKGRRIAAGPVWYVRQRGRVEDNAGADIADDYDLPVEAVLEAIAYCESDPEEIRQDWEAEEALAEALGDE